MMMLLTLLVINEERGQFGQKLQIQGELWSLLNLSVEQFCVAWRKALRRILDLPYNCHSYLLPLVTDSLLFPSSMKYVNVRYDLLYPVLSGALL